MKYVTGALEGIRRLNERLAAAIEKVMLVPHWWQRFAVEPTRVPQAGQSFGRGCFSSERKMAANCSRHLSSFQRQRCERGNGNPCGQSAAFL